MYQGVGQHLLLNSNNPYNKTKGERGRKMDLGHSLAIIVIEILAVLFLVVSWAGL